MLTSEWDTLIVNGIIFDGSGKSYFKGDLAIKDGNIVAMGHSLPASKACRVVDADSMWVLPGMLDIHTHLDLELELDSRLPEVVRHGTTTVLIGNCSLGLAFGKQQSTGQDPIVDCFTRVENIPKSVLRKAIETIDWDNTASYMDHLEGMSLGPNVGVFLPHSMLRVEVMGLTDSISRCPTEYELVHMENLLQRAMVQGYLGLSTDGLPFHYLANEPHTDKRIPAQFARFGELKRMLKIVRSYDRVWQTTPIIENRAKGLFYFLLSSGRLFGKKLKTSALSAVDFSLAPKVTGLFLKLASLINSRLLQGHIHFQALGSNFRIWSDGIVSPIYEEMSATSQLIAKDYDDVEGRRKLLDDPQFIIDFRKQWHAGRRGFNLSHLKTKLGLPDHMVFRELNLMTFDGAPVDVWDGETLQLVFERLVKHQSMATNKVEHIRSAEEKSAFDLFQNPIGDDADFMLGLLKSYDKKFRYWSDVANTSPDRTLELLLHKNTLPGFNDSGAHITNMAFFDANLMSLKLAQTKSLDTVSQMIKRLTSEPADFFGLDVGRLEVGGQADIAIIDPNELNGWHTDDTRELVFRDIFQHKQMVNRPENIVRQVFIRGQEVWGDNVFTDALKEGGGRVLKAGSTYR